MLGLSLLCANSAAAAIAADTDYFWLEPWRIDLYIPLGQLTNGDSAGVTVVGFQAPLHGTLTQGIPGGGLLYVPNLDFWTLGVDAFVYTLRNTAGEETTGLAVIGARSFQDLRTQETFEEPGLALALQYAQNAGYLMQVDGVVKIVGTPEAESCVFGHCYQFAERGDGNVGGRSQGGYNMPPPPPPPGGILVPPGPDMLLLRVATLNGDTAWVETQPRLDSEAVRLHIWDTAGSEVIGPWREVGIGPHSIDLQWWVPESGAPNGGALLRVDGRAVERLAVPLLRGGDDVSFGALEPFAIPAEGLVLDDLEFHGTALADQITYKILETFDDNNFVPLTAVGGVAMTAAAAHASPRGVAFAAATAPAYVVDGTAIGSAAWAARFRLALNGLVPPGQEAINLVYGEKTGTAAGILFRLQARKNSQGSWQLRVAGTRDDFVEVASSWFSFTPTGTGQVELEWRSSPSPRLARGLVRLWVGGQLVGELRGLDNDGRTMSRARFGNLVAVAGATGEVRLDNLVTWQIVDR